MHPADVAELLVDEFKRLADEIEAHPELRAQAPVFAAGPPPVITIALTKVERPMIAAQVPMGVLGPGGGQLLMNMGAIDLSRCSERELVLELGCDRYDGLPPTAQLLAPDGTQLPAEQWPTDPAGTGIVDGHPDYSRKFFCRRGLREFHSHPQHEDEPWDTFREALRLPAVALGLLADLQNRFIVAD